MFKKVYPVLNLVIPPTEPILIKFSLLLEDVKYRGIFPPPCA